ncbi:acyl-CoA dehydrogenase family protein [Streptomyces sp. NPDC006925]
MDFRYTPEQAELKARAAAYSQRLMSYENESEEADGPLPAETVRTLTREAVDAGVFAINMPVEWGGAGLSLLDQVIVEEEFGKVTNCLWDIPWRPANVLAYGTEAQREKYLLPVIRGERFDAFAVTEPGAGSDAGSGTSTADPVPGGWLLNGEKWFVTCGDVADFLLVQADAGPDRQPTLFFVDKQAPGVRMSRVPRFMHSAVNGHPEFVFQDVFVADEDVLGGVGNGYELTKEWFTDERLMIAARTTGAAERALELARDWAVERRQFGSRIADFQLIQGMLADCAVDIAVNRAYTHQVAWEADQPETDRKTLHAKASTAKLAASEAAGRVVDRCLQIFGGRGYDRSYPVERLYREVRVDRIWEGTSEIQRLIIANELIKRGTRALALPLH